MYTTSFIIEKIGVTGAYKVLYCIMNDDSILDVILRLINNEEALR